MKYCIDALKVDDYISNKEARRAMKAQKLNSKLHTIGYELEVLPSAADNDIMGRIRETENYAKYAQSYELSDWEFVVLTSKAVKAFHDGRQVSLDELCHEVIKEHDQE